MGGSFVDDDWEFGAASDAVRTVVLVGVTGNGKSATGNSILRRKAFKSMTSAEGVTKTCELQRAVMEDGQIINVIDTPGLFDRSVEPEFIGKEIVRCIDMAKDGIHAVLVVSSVRSRVTKEGGTVIETLQEFFGNKIAEYMIVVITGGDDFEDNDVTCDEYLRNSEYFKETLEICGNRWVLFDNKTKDEAKKAEQLRQLFLLVNEVVMKNGGKPYTDELFVALKKGAMRLRDQAAEVNSMYSKEHKFEMEEQMYKSYEDHLKRITEMVEAKLRDTTRRLEQQLAEEQAARLKAEAIVKEAQMKSDDEIRKLREHLERSQKEAEEFKKSDDEIRKLRADLERARRESEEIKKHAGNGVCAIL